MATDRRTLDANVRALVAALKCAKPFSIIAVTNNGDEHSIALVGQRARYERAARSAISLNAVLVRCIDPDGKITETIGIDGVPTAEEGRPIDARERSFDKELRAMLAIMADATDKVAARYENMLKQQAETSKQLTDAAIGVMKISSERSGKLEASVLRLVSVRERDVDARERELQRAMRQLAKRQGEEDDDDEDDDDDPFADPNIQKIIKIAGKAIGLPDDPAS